MRSTAARGRRFSATAREAFDFVAVEDCARANLCAMKADAADRFYNVGTGKRTSLKELAEKLLKLTGSNRAHQLCAAQPGDAGAQSHRQPGARQSRDRFRGAIALEEGLERLIAWRRTHIDIVARKRSRVRD